MQIRPSDSRAADQRPADAEQNGPLRPPLTSPAWTVRDTPLDGLEQPTNDDGVPHEQQQAPQAQKGTKRSRASMPSWDEIVFGARSDDDLA